MGGYCGDCGNALCICEEMNECETLNGMALYDQSVVDKLKQQLKETQGRASALQAKLDKAVDDYDTILLALENISIAYPKTKEVYESFKALKEIKDA